MVVVIKISSDNNNDRPQNREKQLFSFILNAFKLAWSHLVCAKQFKMLTIRISIQIDMRPNQFDFLFSFISIRVRSLVVVVISDSVMLLLLCVLWSIPFVRHLIIYRYVCATALRRPIFFLSSFHFTFRFSPVFGFLHSFNIDFYVFFRLN